MRLRLHLTCTYLPQNCIYAFTSARSVFVLADQNEEMLGYGCFVMIHGHFLSHSVHFMHQDATKNRVGIVRPGVKTDAMQST